MDNSTYEVRLSRWTAIVEESENRPPNVSKRQWLADHDIPEKQYYYWLRRVRKAAFSQMEPQLPALQSKAETSIVQLPAAEILSEDPRTPAIIIRTKKSTIEFSSELSESALLKLLKAVSRVI